MSASRGKSDDVKPEDVESENARCPDCGSAKIDRVDKITSIVRRRIERIEDTNSIYGLRPFSSQPDRDRHENGRGGGRLECANCGWNWDGSAGDAQQSPEYQQVLARLRTD